MNGERTFTKRNFMEFVHRVTPIQNFFLQEGCEADNDVLQVLFELQMDLAEGMIDGACAFAQHTGREQVVEEDLLNYLDTCWKLDPLLISEKFYRVEEAVKDLSAPTENPPEHKGKKRSGTKNKAQPATSKVKKSSQTRQSKPK
ncbi:uncharacterized protein LOC129971089 isoform X1 [Argiope bruennichi]|uniref:uncharacterized protein LOC129971089 isoform X1 n=1 Tax=Argiope bruennichi TaxID=94029 RepID=UPI002494C474|nr:uncharacterized protein LOC129971089 isoform X1 [Argiope bruennichi]